MRKLFLFLALLTGLLNLNGSAKANCVGKFLNPLTDICWKCVFPLKIAGMTVISGGSDPESPGQVPCFCQRPPIPVPVPGIPVSFWEPARLVDVTRTPYCLVNMGGMSFGSNSIHGRGDVEGNPDDGNHNSFYQVHWYVYPILYALEVLVDFACLDKASIDIAYLTELDPFWNDDEKGAILNPEGILFGNVIAQAACIADCTAATVNLPLDTLFWCSGCQGSLYPFTGTITEHMGGVQASLLATGRMIAKLHREGLVWGTSGTEALCGKYFLPILKKSQYRLQMTYPYATDRCDPIGRTEVPWQMGKEFPYKGSDFGYLIWRKRDCCLL